MVRWVMVTVGGALVWVALQFEPIARPLVNLIDWLMR